MMLWMQDENRYKSSRGAHVNLKRDEKAGILVNKIPGTTHITHSMEYNDLGFYCFY